jgi:hypothetical protein
MDGTGQGSCPMEGFGISCVFQVLQSNSLFNHLSSQVSDFLSTYLPSQSGHYTATSVQLS